MPAADQTFGPFSLDPDGLVLRRDGRPVDLGQRAPALLVAARRGVVGKDRLMDLVWPGRAGEEGNLTVRIAALRKALGPMPDGRDWIVALPRRGFRLATAQAPACP